MVCPKCHASNDAAVAFCKRCGASLHKEAPESRSTNPAIETQEAGAEPARPATTTPSDRQFTYAGFGWRLLAVLIDSALQCTVSFAAIGAVVVGAAWVTDGNIHPTTMRVILAVLSIGLLLAIAWLYEAYMVSSTYQATLGMMAVGIVVTDLQGRRLSFWHATGRLLSKFVSTIPLYAGFLIQPFTEKPQALHDMMAGCLVLRKAPR